MSRSSSTITVDEVLHELLPKLETLDRQVAAILSEPAGAAWAPEERERRQRLHSEFSLQLLKSRLNLEHLLRRYPELFVGQPGKRPASGDVVLWLDAHEEEAVRIIREAYSTLESAFR